MDSHRSRERSREPGSRWFGDDQFELNAAAGQSRQQTINDTTAGVQKNVDQMREQARALPAKQVANRRGSRHERDQQVPLAAEFDADAAVEAANAAKPQEPEAAKEPDAGTPDPSYARDQYPAM